MDPVCRNMWGAVFLLTLWSASGSSSQLCLKKQLSAAPGSCRVELISSGPNGGSNIQWFRGSQKLAGDQEHQLSFGGHILEVTLSPQAGETVYRMKGQSAGAEIAVDLRETCGFGDGVHMLPDSSWQQYQKVKIVLTAMFMAIWAAALLITFRHCREESSTKETQPRMDKGEEGIYSDLVIPGIHPDPKHLGQDQGQWAQAGPKGPSGPTAEVKAGPSSDSVRQQAKGGPGASRRRQAGAGPSSGSVRDQAEAGPAVGLRGQAGADLSSPQTEPAQDSTYTSLKPRVDDADYQHCGAQRPEVQSVVTFSAQDDEVNIQTSP